MKILFNELKTHFINCKIKMSFGKIILRNSGLFHFTIFKRGEKIIIYEVLDFGVLSYLLDSKISEKIEYLNKEIYNFLLKKEYTPNLLVKNS